MRNKNAKKLVSTFIIGIILGICTMSAFAGMAESSWGYYGPISGYYYENLARIYVYSDGDVLAQTVVQTDGGGNVPAGYMGAKARLFKDDALYVQTSMDYNSSSTSYLLKATSMSYYGYGTYYSKGITAAYNGSGYDTYYTFQSPSQSW